jgi:hypothetical protein
MAQMGQPRRVPSVGGRSALPPIATERRAWTDVCEGSIASFQGKSAEVRFSPNRRHPVALRNQRVVPFANKVQLVGLAALDRRVTQLVRPAYRDYLRTRIRKITAA